MRFFEEQNMLIYILRGDNLAIALKKRTTDAHGSPQMPERERARTKRPRGLRLAASDRSGRTVASSRIKGNQGRSSPIKADGMAPVFPKG